MKLTGVEECRGSTVTVLPPSQSCKFGLRLWTARDFALVDMLQACISEWQEEEDSKILVRDKCDRAITCVFCQDLHLTLMFSGLLQKDLFKGK